ncbi:hypothetical protein LPTSP4_31880 [Leptospira ryugenii]|uniref:Uncharacterized protein n=1 Tax=Leptospira ryugenii TaxID=1917863 RepID=A0A2P2E442_9LEPT|nr:hypothetical protein [Leptospira ryugenii]GBF51650.1 hypothetical protein LPTSP4_31880 [Leptospira ryugenii]
MRKRIIILFVLLLLVGIGLVWKTKSQIQKEGNSKKLGGYEGDPSLIVSDQNYLSEQSTEIDIEQVIDDYMSWAEYPPNSRPLHESHTDLLNPKVIPVVTQEMPILEKGSIKASGFSCSLQPEYHSVTEGKTLRIFLSCFRTGSANRESIKIIESDLKGKAGNRSIFPPSLQANDSGMDGDERKGDLVYTFHFRPQRTDWADFYLTTKFTIDADETHSIHSLSHHFFSSPIAPANFTGRYEDYLSEGSLLIEVELDVKEVGRYTIEANLMTETGEPIAYARRDQKLNTGKQRVALLFFGRAITKRRENGPFHMTFLRGELNTDVIQEDMLSLPPEQVDIALRSVRDDRPKKKLIPYWDDEITTKAYLLSEFKADIYESDEKQNRIAELKALKDR